jgi:hypothetical protein
LAQEVSIDYEFIAVYEKFLANASDQAFEGVPEVVITAEGFANEETDEGFNLMEFSFEVVSIAL